MFIRNVSICVSDYKMLHPVIYIEKVLESFTVKLKRLDN
jgi:hypothetical protein